MHPDRVLRRSFCRSAAGILTTLLLIIASRPATAVSRGFAFTGELGVGHDDNFFRQRVARHSSANFPYDLAASYGIRLDSGTRMSLSARGMGALYAAPNQDGRTTEEDADLRLVRRLLTGDRRHADYLRLDLLVQGSFDQVHRTNFSRSAGEEFFVVVNGDTLSLKDRYNYRAVGYSAGLTLRWPAPSEWSVTFDQARRNYINDYRNIPTVDPLDLDDTGFEIGLGQRVTSFLQADLLRRWASLNYDALTARDVDGNRVVGKTQVYHYATWRMGLSTRQIRWSRWHASYEYRTRTDPFQGYFDYSEWSIRPGMDLEPGPRWEMELDFQYTHTKYKRARVGYNPLKPLRDDIDRSLSARALYRLDARNGILAQVIHENTHERNPIYTYRRTRGWIGYQFRY